MTSYKRIHPTAIIEEGAEIGLDVEVGPYSHIRAGARIGNGTRIQSHVCIWGQSEIGELNEIYPYCSIGAPPQVIKDEALQSRAVIGHRNVFREGVQIHRGSTKAGGLTKVGNDNYIMSSVHVAHDCQLGNNITIASHTGLAGHVVVFDHALISGICGVAQFVRIGSFTYSAGMTRYMKDLPHFLCAKEYCEITGPNLVGLKRAGHTEEDIRIVKEIYKALYINKEKTLKEQMEKLHSQFSGKSIFDKFEDFVKTSKVGIMRG
jgi:UDP-N-acetylglucosamine acyltransferase